MVSSTKTHSKRKENLRLFDTGSRSSLWVEGFSSHLKQRSADWFVVFCLFLNAS